MKAYNIILLLAGLLNTVHSFCPSPHQPSSSIQARQPISNFPRGGADTISGIHSSTKLSAGADMLNIVLSNLESGPYGQLSLTAIFISTVLPLTLYKQSYAFSVGYGASVFAAAAVVFQQLSLSSTLDQVGSLLTIATMAYGLRLALFLLYRASSMKSTYKDGDVSSKVKLALSVSPFYAFLTTPMLVAARVPIDITSSNLGLIGVTMASVGLVLEAVADFQKTAAKGANPDAGDKFVGPTSGAYLVCRHPNYLGELLFWFGSFLAAVPSLGTSYGSWACAILGQAGIFSIMTGATKRLEGKQEEKYKGQQLYEDWKDKVEAPLFPFVK